MGLIDGIESIYKLGLFIERAVNYHPPIRRSISSVDPFQQVQRRATRSVHGTPSLVHPKDDAQSPARDPDPITWCRIRGRREQLDQDGIADRNISIIDRIGRLDDGIRIESTKKIFRTRLDQLDGGRRVNIDHQIGRQDNGTRIAINSINKVRVEFLFYDSGI